MISQGKAIKITGLLNYQNVTYEECLVCGEKVISPSFKFCAIVKGGTKMIIEKVNADFGIRTPIICTPEELMVV